MKKILKGLVAYAICGVAGTVIGWYVQILIEEVFK